MVLFVQQPSALVLNKMCQRYLETHTFPHPGPELTELVGKTTHPRRGTILEGNHHLNSHSCHCCSSINSTRVAEAQIREGAMILLRTSDFHQCRRQRHNASGGVGRATRSLQLAFQGRFFGLPLAPPWEPKKRQLRPRRAVTPFFSTICQNTKKLKRSKDY